MKRIKKLLSYAILLGGITLLPACGGGSGGGSDGIVATDDSSNQTFVEPVKSGVVLSNGLNGRAVVGETYVGKLSVNQIDSRNQITSYAVSNPTTGGAVPTVSGDGTVTWVPNAIDVNTPALKVVVTQAQGETPTSTATASVSVYAKTLELSADIVPNQAFYSDSEGVYSVQIGSRSGAMPTGKILVYSYRSAAGGVSYSIKSTVADVFGILRDYPRATRSTGGLQTQSSTSKAPANIRSGMTTIVDELTAHDVEAQGSVLYDNDHKVNTYTLRSDSISSLFVNGPDAADAHIEYATSGQQIIQIDASCIINFATNTCSKAKAPVILIHGFTPEIMGIGGGVDTWGTLPKHLQDAEHDVFEFRWLTHLRFEEAAGQLTHLINSVARKTGKKPIVVAHSFGGLVGHLALGSQGIEWKNQQWQKVKLGNGIFPQLPSDVVDKLITLGSPIGGIYDGDSLAQLPGMEWGRQRGDQSINTCLSITCVQAGASDVNIDDFKWALSAINYAMPPVPTTGYLPPTFESYDEQLARSKNPDLINYAETIARIGTITTVNVAVARIAPVLHGVKTVALVGVGSSDFDPTLATIGHLGDGLISLKGQIHPNDVGVLSTFFNQSEITKTLINPTGRLLQVSSRKVANMKYIFAGNMGHTASGFWGKYFHINPDYHEIPEPYVNGEVNGRIAYCPSLKHTKEWSFRTLRDVITCVGNVVLVDHPLVSMISDPTLIDSKIDYTYTDIVRSPWYAYGTLKTAAILVAAAETIPFSVEVRDRSTGDRVMRTFAYATNIDGTFQIDLNSLIDVSVAGFNRANLYANLYLGDGLTYEAQRVSIQNLNLDRIDIPEITLERIANRPGMINVSGRVIDGQTNGLGIDQAVIRIAKGIGLSATDLQYVSTSNTSRVVRTDASGNFFINQLRPGIYSAFVQKTGYVDEIQGRLTVSANGSLTLSLLKILAPGEASVTLRWDTAAGGTTVVSDLDSHMLRFNATGALDYHIFYSARVGLDGDSLDRDDTDYEGPETVTFNPKSATNYVYYVHQYSSAGTIPGSKPLVTVRLGSQAYRFDLPVSASTTGRYWRVFDMVNGQVRPCTANCLQTAAPNTITTQSGALAQLPADVRPYMSSMPAKQ